MTDITAPVQAALDSDVVRPHRFVTIQFPDYTLRVWSGIGDFVLGGQTFTGVGNLGDIAPITDTSTDGVTTFNSQRVQLTLSGLDLRVASEVNNIEHQGSPVSILEAQMDANWGVIRDPYSIFDGEIDTMSTSIDANGLTVTIQADNFIAYMFRGPDGRRRTDADQQGVFPGDFGFEFAGKLAGTILWNIPTTVQQTKSAAALSATSHGFFT